MRAEKSSEIIKKSSERMKKPVRLVLFQTDRGCAACADALELCREIKAHMSMIALETYDMVMDRDKSEQYGIKQVPAVVVQGADGQAATFYGLTEDIFLDVLMDTIRAVSEEKVWFPE